MAWKDPFELTVDAVVDDFGQYLSKTTSLSPVEQARAMEVCRDFCTYLCKDAHDAATQDYVVYLQLHSFTPEDKEDYERFLGLIRTFCSIVPPRSVQAGNLKSESTGFSKKQRASMKDLFSVALDDSSSGGGGGVAPWDQNLDKKRKLRERTRRPTLTADSFDLPTPPPMIESGLLSAPGLNSDLLKAPHLSSGLFVDENLKSVGADKSSPSSHPAPASSAPVDSLDNMAFSRLGNIQRNTQEPTDKGQLSGMFQIGAMGNSVQLATPARPVKSNLSAVQQRSTPPRPQEAVEHKSNTGISGFDFSFDDKLNGGRRSSVLEPVVRRDSIADVVNEKQDTTGARQESALKRAEEENSKLRSAEAGSNMRGVDGISYDFSKNGIKRVLSVEDSHEQTLSEAIDKRLVGGFRPFVFDGKYTIDCPTPDAEQYTAGKASFFNVFVAAQPAIICAVLSLLAFMVMPIVGVAFFVLTVFAVIFALPDFLPPQNMTTHAAVMTLIQAKRGRCYCKATALTAKPTSGEAPIDPAALWKGDLLAWPKALMARFNEPKGLKFKTVSGSEAKNAVVILFEMDGGYYLVPLVRPSTGWFVTDVSLTKRSFESEKPES